MDWTQRMTAALEYLENCLENDVDMEQATQQGSARVGGKQRQGYRYSLAERV